MKKQSYSRHILVAIIGFLILLLIFVNVNKPKASSINYKTLSIEPTQAVILLEDNVSAEQLNLVADSLFYYGHASNQNYKVMFYYRPDWQGHLYFAGKFWQYDEVHNKYNEEKLDITNIKSIDQ